MQYSVNIKLLLKEFTIKIINIIINVENLCNAFIK